jgi:hypothetical protein
VSGLSEDERALLVAARQRNLGEYDERTNAERHRDDLLIRLDDALARLAEAWDEGAIWAGAIRLNGTVSSANPYRTDAPARDESED